MANILKQSTQIKVRIGPFVDSTDAVTPETGVALSTADQAELLKANGAATVDISGATWAAVTGSDGWYDLTLTTSHTDTVGELVVVVQDSSVCLPVFARFQVVEEAIYDAMFAASATGLLPANVTQISGDSTAADNLEAALDGTGGVTISANLDGYAELRTSGGTAGTNAAELVDLVWDESITAGNHNVAQSAARFLRESAEATAGTVDTAQSGAAGSITLAAGESSTDDIFIGERISILEGTGAGQARLITDYNGTTKVATVHRNWDVTPDGTSLYAIQGADADVIFVQGQLATATGTVDFDNIAAILTDTAEIGAAGAGLTAIPWNVSWDAEVQSECTDALNAYDPPTNAEMEARTIAAANYATAANLATVDTVVDNLNLGIIYGSAATGTLSTTQASTDLTGYADDQLIGRTVVWTSGACEGEASDITDYAETNGVLTFTALTAAPGNGDTFKIV